MVFDYTHYTGASTASDVWPTWIQNTTASTTSTATWNTWVVTSAQLAHAAYQVAQRDFGVQHAERAREAQERRQQATERARELLCAHLDPEQRQRFEQTREFEVEAPSGHRYRIEYGEAGNVILLDEEGAAEASFCIHPHQQVPVPDVMLAQKLWLETDEEEFCRVANRTELRRRVAA